MPYTLREEIAKRNNTPRSIFERTRPSPKGITAHPKILKKRLK